jgi:hypothetical protein
LEAIWLSGIQSLLKIPKYQESWKEENLQSPAHSLAKMSWQEAMPKGVEIMAWGRRGLSTRVKNSMGGREKEKSLMPSRGAHRSYPTHRTLRTPSKDERLLDLKRRQGAVCPLDEMVLCLSSCQLWPQLISSSTSLFRQLQH